MHGEYGLLDDVRESGGHGLAGGERGGASVEYKTGSLLQASISLRLIRGANLLI